MMNFRAIKHDFISATAGSLLATCRQVMACRHKFFGEGLGRDLPVGVSPQLLIDAAPPNSPGYGNYPAALQWISILRIDSGCGESATGGDRLHGKTWQEAADHRDSS
jgi:hypothetical protein